MKHLTELIERPRPATSADDHPGRETRRSLGLWWTFAAGLVLAGVAIVAIVQNSRPVELHYLGWHANVSLVAVVLATALVAILLDEIGGLVWRRRRRSLVGRRDELAQLRTERRQSDEASAADALAARRVGPEI